MLGLSRMVGKLVGRVRRRSNRVWGGACTPFLRPPSLLLAGPYRIVIQWQTCGPAGPSSRAVQMTPRGTDVALMVNRGGIRGHKYWAGRGKIL